MNATHSPHGQYQQMQRAITVILIFQAVFLFAQVFNDGQHSNAMVGVLVATIAMSATNRRLYSNSQGRHTTQYINLWRYGALALLGVLTVLVALRAYAPEALPSGTPSMIAMLLSAFIALKGAVLGKLKPNGVFGLRLPWTCRSHLAWEKAHRLLGRILFFGGLFVLVASPFVHFAAAFVGLGVIIVGGVAASAIESWLVWRRDPERRV